MGANPAASLCQACPLPPLNSEALCPASHRLHTNRTKNRGILVSPGLLFSLTLPTYLYFIYFT